jgi:hypothetical protein
MLAIEEISGYLPHGLKLFEISRASFINEPDCKEIVDWTTRDIQQPFRKRHRVKSCKPILYPLQSFGGNMTLGEVREQLNCTHENAVEIWDLFTKSLTRYPFLKTIDEISVSTYNVILKNFIDYQDLIGQGKAVCVEEFDINPYKSK